MSNGQTFNNGQADSAYRKLTIRGLFITANIEFYLNSVLPESNG